MTRQMLLRLHRDDLIVDNFAGGGGASLGIEMALGRSPDIAINHDPEAIAMHAENHPATRHLCESVWDVDPKEVTDGRPVALAWFSPDCTHHSKAKGSKPRSKSIRGLAWVVIDWAKSVKPRIIFLENVEEFRGWGPLLANGKPCPVRKGTTFRQWVSDLEDCGYQVEVRELSACDYGAPTTRKRLFLIARCDGEPIVWPAATHGEGLEAAHRTAAECIEWAVPCRSIFDRPKPLVDNTLRRIARGIERFVLSSADPFVFPVTHQGDTRVHSIREPMRTITAAHRGEYALASPTLIQVGYGERKGQAPRVPGLHKPLGTVVAGGRKHALVAAFLSKHYGGNYTGAGVDLGAPMHTVTAVDHHAFVSTFLSKYYGAGTGQHADEPMHTVTARDRFALVSAFLTKFYGTSTGQALSTPMHTVTGSGQHLALVTVQGARYAIADIGMRMLIPRELFRAQGFPDSYRIDLGIGGKALSKTAQVRMAGNSVCPPIAAALVAANVASARQAPKMEIAS